MHLPRERTEQEPIRIVTPEKLTSAAGPAAVAAGLIFILIQFGHPSENATTVATVAHQAPPSKNGTQPHDHRLTALQAVRQARRRR